MSFSKPIQDHEAIQKWEKFDESCLELIYQEVTSKGVANNFNKLVYPENDKSSFSKKMSHTKHSSKPASKEEGKLAP